MPSGATFNDPRANSWFGPGTTHSLKANLNIADTPTDHWRRQGIIINP